MLTVALTWREGIRGVKGTDAMTRPQELESYSQHVLAE